MKEEADLAVRLYRRSTDSYLCFIGRFQDAQHLSIYVYLKYPGWEVDQVALAQV